MNMKTILLSIILCTSLPMFCSESDSDATAWRHIEQEPTKRTVAWLHWCLKNSDYGLNDPELVNNRDLYIQLLQQHIAKLESKLPIIDLISDYKWKKGRLDLEAGALALALAYAAHEIAGMESVIKDGYDSYFTGAYVLSLFSMPFITIDAVLNISKSIDYKEHIYAKLKRDQDALALLAQQ